MRSDEKLTAFLELETAIHEVAVDAMCNSPLFGLVRVLERLVLFDCETQDSAVLLRRCPTICVLKIRDQPLPVGFGHLDRAALFQS